MAMDNMHNNLAKIARMVLEIASRTDRQTHRRTHHNTLDNFTTDHVVIVVIEWRLFSFCCWSAVATPFPLGPAVTKITTNHHAATDNS